jgi:type III restriction enzyme
MSKIEAPKISVVAGKLNVVKGGVDAQLIGAGTETIWVPTRALPDVLAYLQNETELTRSTLVRILRESGRLAEIFANPQRFLDQVAAILKFELHRLLVDGIKYEKIVGRAADAEWEQLLFKNEELVNFLTAQPVTKAPYEYVVYDSEVERAFAQGLESRDDIRLFMKLPDWFKVDTPLGGYNPDWAILKQESETIYLVRETKGTKDFLKLRTSEADKVRCGKAHFDALGVPFEVAVTAAEI